MSCRPPTQRHSMPGASTRSVESPWRAIGLLDTQGRCPALLHFAPLGLENVHYRRGATPRRG